MPDNSEQLPAELLKEVLSPIPPHIEMKKIESSNLAYVGYDEANTTMYVQFHTGAIYRYHNVYPSVHEALMMSVSKGSYFYEVIRKHEDQYPFFQLRGPDKKK